MRGNDTVTFSGVTVLHETDPGESGSGSLLCDVEGEEVWIPKSQIHDDSEVYEDGTDGDLVISRWIAEKKGLA